MKQSTSHRAVARYLALGLPLEDICSYLSLDYERWSKIIKSALFQGIVKEIEKEIEERIIEDSLVDKTYLKLKMAASKAADRLIEEVDNVDAESGASANSRITAAKAVLAATGLGEEREDSKVIVLSLSQAKLDKVFSSPSKEPSEQPSSVVGGR